VGNSTRAYINWFYDRFYIHPLANVSTAKEFDEYQFPELTLKGFEKAKE